MLLALVDPLPPLSYTPVRPLILRPYGCTPVRRKKGNTFWLEMQPLFGTTFWFCLPWSPLNKTDVIGLASVGRAGYTWARLGLYIIS
jgi:hypothetical protein